MEYPTLYVKGKSTQVTDAFAGYNHNLRIDENEFYDMQNMTSDCYPVLAPRKNRGLYRDGIQANGIIAKDKLCYVDGSCFVFGDKRIDMGLTDTPKTLVSMGAYVIILPDKKYVDTLSDGYWDSIDVVNKSTGNVTLTLCTSEGATGIPSNEAPEDPFDGELWLDTSNEHKHTLKQYSTDNREWVDLAVSYTKITAAGIARNIKQYDGVNISGLVGDAGHLNNSFVAYGSDEMDSIIVNDTIKKLTTQETPIEVSRKMPELDFVVESGNRLWGCRYGNQTGNGFVNEIYASKLGDFKNWECFMGLSTDSYRVSCGTDGAFTGAITHNGNPLFFKENHIHRVYGSIPSNFQIQAIACRGVQSGCDKSLATVNETVFYKARNGVCAYDGSMPVEISSAFGDVRYGNAVAGAHGNKYYISMVDEDKNPHLFVFDTSKGVWHREDGLRVDQFCSFGNDMYCIEHNTKHIISLFGTDTMDADRVRWMVETGTLGMSLPDMKYVSKILIRMSLELAGKVAVSIQYDSTGHWDRVCEMTATSMRSFYIPVRPQRCDHFRIRIEGEGICRIYSITKTIEQGSDVS